jgi:hypothetical protein
VTVRENVQESTDSSDPPDWLDRDDPYDGVQTDRLPDWWVDAIEEFREHDIGPYRPPRFSDDALVPPVVARLESEFDVDIRFVGVGVQHGDSWRIYVDDEAVTTVDRERTPSGYTRYHVRGDRFESEIRNHVESGPDVAPDRADTSRTDGSDVIDR